MYKPTVVDAVLCYPDCPSGRKDSSHLSPCGRPVGNCLHGRETPGPEALPSQGLQIVVHASGEEGCTEYRIPSGGSITVLSLHSLTP